MVEHCVRNAKVEGSSPFLSTTTFDPPNASDCPAWGCVDAGSTRGPFVAQICCRMASVTSWHALRIPGCTRFSFVWSSGRWRCQPRARVKDEVRTGPLSDSQQEASKIGAQIAEELKAQSAGAPSQLGPAIERIIEEELASGTPPATVRGVYQFPGEAITKRYLGPDTAMGKLTAEDVCYLIDEALGEVSAETVRRYLRVLNRACEVSGVVSPVPRAVRARRKALRTTSHAARRDFQFFLPHEVEPILEQVRNFDMRGRTERIRDADANLIALFAYTGIRSGEAARLEARDINLGRREVLIREPKVKFAQRIIPSQLPLDPMNQVLSLRQSKLT